MGTVERPEVSRVPRWVWIAVAVAVVVIVVAGVVLLVNRQSNADSTNPWRTALVKLETLPINGRAPKTGYSRHVFGRPRTDDADVEDGHNGCDTRDDILRRDLAEVTIEPGSNGCAVVSGTLNDPYTGTTILFHRGTPSVQN